MYKIHLLTQGIFVISNDGGTVHSRTSIVAIPAIIVIIDPISSSVFACTFVFYLSYSEIILSTIYFSLRNGRFTIQFHSLLSDDPFNLSTQRNERDSRTIIEIAFIEVPLCFHKMIITFCRSAVESLLLRNQEICK